MYTSQPASCRQPCLPPRPSLITCTTSCAGLLARLVCVRERECACRCGCGCLSRARLRVRLCQQDCYVFVSVRGSVCAGAGLCVYMCVLCTTSCAALLARLVFVFVYLREMECVYVIEFLCSSASEIIVCACVWERNRESVCVWLCMRVHRCVCIMCIWYIYMYMYRTYTHMCVYIYVYTNVQKHVCISMYVYMQYCTRTKSHSYIYIYIHIRIHTYVYAFRLIRMYMYICIHVQMYVYACGINWRTLRRQLSLLRTHTYAHVHRCSINGGVHRRQLQYQAGAHVFIPYRL